MASRNNKPTYDDWVFSLPRQWRHYTSSTSRKDIEWFQSLLRAYDLHIKLFLETLSGSSRERRKIIFPCDADDEVFDRLVLKECCSNYKCQATPKESNAKELIRELRDCIAKCLEKKKVLIKLGQMISENLRWQSDMQKVLDEKLDAQRLLEHTKEETSCLKVQVEELNKVIKIHSEQLTKEKARSSKMSCQLQQIKKEKEELLIRLSQIAGSKLTSNNPDIADLSDDNRPTKLAEKFGQLYDDAWTDSLEELTEVEAKLDDRMAIRFLLRIVMTAYQFCSGPRSMFLDLADCQTIVTCTNPEDMKVLIKFPDASKADIQPRTQMRLHAKETVSDLQKKFLVILSGVFRDMYRTEKFNSSVSDKSETNPWELDEGKAKETSPVSTLFTTDMYNKGIYNTSQGSKEEPGRKSKSARGDFSQPRYETYSKDRFILQREDVLKMLRTPIKSQVESANPETKFAKTTIFAERCVELCWFMQTTRPPIHLSVCTPGDGKMNGDVYKAYTKSGTEVDYVVWPAMYLYEKGPLMTKGIAQPK